MEKYYLGIDLGTSAVKAVVLSGNGKCADVRVKYREVSIAGWLEALKTSILEIGRTIPLESITALGFSSQVGTYITDTGKIYGWHENVGRQELNRILSEIPTEEFVEELDMEHPDLISYPLPRYSYIKKNHPECRCVLMPKEILIRELTDVTVTDIFSQRGIAHTGGGEYSRKLLDKLGIDFELPNIIRPTELAGYITQKASEIYSLPVGMPVFAGCNDFFAGLLGMGILKIGTVFELSGTSEHLGLISSERIPGRLVSGRYFNGYVTYGGTKSSGTSCDFAIKNFGIDGIDENIVYENPPIFLPYLKGERAPIYNENARGVFFGINEKTDKNALAYSVLEGVVFSLYHIGKDLLANNSVTEIITGGGSAMNKVMAKIKASLFNCEVFGVTENDTSALGAAMIAMLGAGEFASPEEAAAALIEYIPLAKPDEKLREALLARFEIYESIYLSLENDFNKFSALYRKGE